MAGVLEQAVDPVDVVEIGLGAVAVGQLVHEALEQRGADAARGAETATFVGEEMDEGPGDFEEIARAVEDHEGAGGGHVFVGDAALELVACEADAGGAADLDGLGVAGAAVFENAADLGAEGVFVDARQGAVAGNGDELGAGRLGGARGGKICAAVKGDEAGLGQGFDVVHDRRPAQVALDDGEGRADARGAALAFERFDERAFFAADIGAGAEVDLDVEVETRLAEDVFAQQAGFAAAGQHGFKLRAQVAVLAAQVDKAFAGAHGPGGEAHAFEDEVGVAVEEDAILEGAGLAFVGVADDDFQFTGGVAGAGPFDGGGKARTAAPAQVGGLHFGEPAFRAAGDGRLEGLARRHFKAKQGAL